jgi:hypothetical protein
LERWKLQKEAQIEAMMRRGEPLGAVAAALASPETAERIAILEAATSGRMGALEAARLNLGRAGHDLALLDGLHRMATGQSEDSGHHVNVGESSAQEHGDEEEEEKEEVQPAAVPLPMARRPLARASS